MRVMCIGNTKSSTSKILRGGQILEERITKTLLLVELVEVEEIIVVKGQEATQKQLTDS